MFYLLLPPIQRIAIPSAQSKGIKENKQEQTEQKKVDKKKKTEEVTFEVNMTCGNCRAKIERHISWEKGVKDLKVNLDKKVGNDQVRSSKNQRGNPQKGNRRLGIYLQAA